MKRWLWLFGLMFAGLGTCAFAEDTKPISAPPPAAAEPDKQTKAVKALPTKVSVAGLGILGVSGDADPQPVLGGQVEVDFPFGTSSARGLVDLTFTALPGPSDADLTIRPEDFARYLEVGLCGYLPVGGNLSVYGAFEFNTAVDPTKGIQRYPRRRHAGLMVMSQRGYLQLGIGSDDAAIVDAEPAGPNERPSPFDQLIVKGRIGLAADGMLFVGGDAVLNIVGPTITRTGVLRETRDYARVYVGISFNKLGKKVKA